MRSWSKLAVVLCTLAPTLVACDTRPNANFEEQYEDAREKAAGDKFSGLTGMKGRLTRYLQAAPEQKANYLSSYGSGAANAVSTALETLADLPLGSHAAIGERCKTAIDGALAFKNAPAAELPALRAGAETRLAALTACRSAANAAEDGETPEIREALQGWRRTASTAAMVLGTSLVERGHEDVGVQFWREADKAMAADAPGKKLEARDFYYSLR